MEESRQCIQIVIVRVECYSQLGGKKSQCDQPLRVKTIVTDFDEWLATKNSTRSGR